MSKKDNDFWSGMGRLLDGLADKVAEKTHLKELGKKIVAWAEGHRQAMLKITVAFLVSCCIVCIAETGIKITRSNGLKAPAAIMDSIADGLPRENVSRLDSQYEEYLKARQLEEEIETLLSKDTLTTADSLRLIEIYNIIMEDNEYEKED